MTTAFALSGGSLGAVQVGMLQALAERRFSPDLLVDASAGALNAAFMADRGFGRGARQAAGRWLDAGNHLLPHPERFLSLHHHAALAAHATDCPGIDAA